MSNPHDTDPERFVHAAVQRLNRGVSEKFIPQPTRRQVLGDVLLGLGRFKTAVRWRYFWTERKSRSVSSTPSFSEEPGDDDSSASIDDVSLPYSSRDDIGGLGTGLRPSKAKQAPQASPEVEAFLREVDRTVLSNVTDEPTSKPSRIAAEIVLLEKALRQASVVVIPTDKTNSFRVIPTQDYIRFMNEHLVESAVEVPRDRILEIHSQAQQEFECLGDDGFLSVNELRFLEEGLKGKAIPTPSLLIKDHKQPLADGNFPTHLVIPADSFTSAFPKLGYKGIKKIFDDYGVQYT
jgi:hypothetical protein